MLNAAQQRSIVQTDQTFLNSVFHSVLEYYRVPVLCAPANALEIEPDELLHTT